MALDIWISHGEEWLALEKVNFNGVAKEITVNGDVTEIDIRTDVYSAWVRWVERIENSQYFPAMRFTGLDVIPGGFTGDTYFLINGWKLVYDPRLVSISGILYSDDYPTPYYFTDGSPVYPATVSALGIKSNVTVDYNSLAVAVATQFAEPSITTAGIASAIGTVDVDSTEIADAVAGRFSIGADGRVAADITGSTSAADIRKTVNAAIPSFPSAATIWDSAPRHLKKSAKTKDYSDAIRDLSNKLDGLYTALRAQGSQPIPELNLAPLMAAVERSGASSEVLDRIAAISIPDNGKDLATIKAQVESLQIELESITESVVDVRQDIAKIPATDLSSIVTKTEMEMLQSVVSRLSNYDDAQVKGMLEALITNTESLTDDIEAVSRKADLVLDNQLSLL